MSGVQGDDAANDLNKNSGNLAEYQKAAVDFLVWCYSLRIRLISYFFSILVLGIVYSFFIAKPIYQSKIVFLPPVGSDNSFSFLKGLEGFAMSGSQDISSEQIEAIFLGETFGRELIDKFLLAKRYGYATQINPYQRSLKDLRKSISLSNDAIAGVGYTSITAFTLTVEDGNADTAYMIVSEAFKQLDSIVQEISISRAREKRQFIELQFNRKSAQMDSLQIELVKFQKKHKIVDVNEQARMSLDVVSRLESEIMLSEARLELLVRSNGERSSEVAQEKVSLGILRNKLSEIEKKSGADILPGLMNSLDLSIPYYRLVKEIDAKTKVLVYLGQQLESERISEAKSIKRLAVVDRPWKAEYKSKPKRLLLLAVILVFGNLFVFGCFVLRYYWRFHFSKNVVVRRFSEAIGA